MRLALLPYCQLCFSNNNNNNFIHETSPLRTRTRIGKDNYSKLHKKKNNKKKETKHKKEKRNAIHEHRLLGR